MIVDEMKLVAAYLSGNASAEEEKLIIEWLRESPDHEELFRDLQKIWNNSSIILKLNDPETDAEWQRLGSRIESEKNISKVESLLKNHWLKIAASFVVILVSYWMVIKKDSTSVDHPETILAAEDKEAFFYLPDSSKVWLAAHSTLTLEEKYGEKKREVHLKGEGSFDVEHDSLRPFYVMTDEVVVRVVGTSFNVKEDSVVTVTVSEGKVRIYSRESPEHSVMVERGEQAYIKKEKHARPVKIKKDQTPSMIKQEENKVAQPNSDNVTEPESNAVAESEANSDTEIEDNSIAQPADNTVLEKESSDPKTYLSVKSSWRKNQFNQSVVDGTLFNNASLISYRNINLKITYKKENGKAALTYITVYETVRPGQQIDFHKNLVDMFIHTKDLEVEIDNVEIVYPSK